MAVERQRLWFITIGQCQMTNLHPTDMPQLIVTDSVKRKAP
jgi:hypothetical protein